MAIEEIKPRIENQIEDRKGLEKARTGKESLIKNYDDKILTRKS